MSIPDLDTDEARDVAGRAVAGLEDDCSRSWPRCPRPGVVCDCRLRSARVLNALRLHFRRARA